MTIHTTHGKVFTDEEYKEDLLKDKIVVSKPNKEVLSYVIANRKHNFIKAQIVANRHKDTTFLKQDDNLKLYNILTPNFISDRLPEVIEASKIIIEVMKNDGKILLLHDYDTDGVVSGAIGDKMIRKLLKYNNLEVMANTRKLGKGINDNLVDIVLDFENIDLIITSDHGSSDKRNLTRLKEALNCKVIVTDHHLFTDDLAPTNMDVFINPQKRDNEFVNINGTHVLYYTLLYTFYQYIERPVAKDIDYIYYLLNYVGLTVISDMMDLRNYVNRKIVIKMLTSLNSTDVKHEPFWEHVVSVLNNSLQIDEVNIGYIVAPLLNSPGRIADPRLSFELLTADTLEKATDLYREAVIVNDDRKSRQKNVMSSTTIEEYDNGTVKVMLVKGGEGIQGVVSNNVMFGDGFKVVLCFTKSIDPVLGEIYGGSGRSQDDNLKLKDVLDSISEEGFMLGYGGHDKAVGMKIKPNLKMFYDALVEEVNKRGVSEIITYDVDDYIYSLKKLTLNIFDAIDVGPYGIGFKSPVFVSDFILRSYRVSRKSGNFFTLKVSINDYSDLDITAFYTVDNSEVENFKRKLDNTKFIRLVYNVQLNSYKNYNTILINGRHLIIK